MTMADFKDQVATFGGGQALRLADDSIYEPEIDMIVRYLTYMDARHGNIDGSHRREAKRMVKFNYPETYWDNNGICFTSDKMYIGMSPEVCRYMSLKLIEDVPSSHLSSFLKPTGTFSFGYEDRRKQEDYGFGPKLPWLDEPSLAKQSDSADLPVGQMYLVVGLLIQGEYYATPNLYELVQNVKDAGDDDPMVVTHTNAEWHGEDRDMEVS
eukprot:jgi/Tetstr1/434062/TSEL_023206.t1